MSYRGPFTETPSISRRGNKMVSERPGLLEAPLPHDLLRRLNGAPGDSAEHRAIRAELRRREVEKPPSRASTVRRFYLLTANEIPGAILILLWHWQRNFLRRHPVPTHHRDH